MSNIEKIKAEIERRKIDYLNRSYTFVPVAMQQLLEFIDSLPEEKPSEDLEEAAKEIVIKMHPCMKDCTILGDRLTRGQLMALVKAGAEWQAEKCDEETSKLLYAERQTAYINGWHDCKEQMMKDAVEGKVFMSFAPGHNQMVMADVDLPTNTKVKLIIVKED